MLAVSFVLSAPPAGLPGCPPTFDASGKVVPGTCIDCNQSLASGSMLRLTGKRDLGGKSLPDCNCTYDPYPCAIVGPESGQPATIVLPDNDCMLLAHGEVNISGRVRFVVGHKSRQFDCMRDGEAHGSILGSDSNLTFARNAAVSVETTDDTVVINPGGFWTGGWIFVHGTVNASLKRGQMTGINGVLTSSGVRVSSTGRVIASGQAVARGAALEGGDYNSIDGVVECSNYKASDSGGCINAGQYLTIGPTATIRAADAYTSTAGVANGGKTTTLFGSVVAENIHSDDAVRAALPPSRPRRSLLL